MQMNWQSPFPLQGATLASLATDDTAARTVLRSETPRSGGRDRFDYWLIFSICLPVFVWVALIERCIPQFWSVRTGEAAPRSLWALARQHAHRCAKLALQG